MQNDSHSNLTKGSARSRRGAEVVEEGTTKYHVVIVFMY